MNSAAASAMGRRGGIILTAVAGAGFSAVTTQLVAMRELLAAFSGNELVIGISLGAWLLLTGVGAGLGRVVFAHAQHPGGDAAEQPRGYRLLIAGLVWIAVVPLLQVLALRGWRDAVFMTGAAAGLGATVLGSFAVLAPFCIVCGALLSLAAGLQAGFPAASVARVYIADTLGSVAGGAGFTFVFVRHFDHFALLAWPALLNLGLAVVLAARARAAALLTVAATTAAGLLALLAATDVDALSIRWQHRGDVVFRAHSPYGRLVVVADSGKLTFFENGEPTSYTENTAHVEETVHYAMAQRPGARRVLLLGGVASGTAPAVLRHGVESVTCVELDPLALDAARRLAPASVSAPRIECIIADGRRYLQQTTARFDVVIVDLPDPSTWQMNRFFTREFYADVRRVLSPGGVLAFGLGRYENYVSPTLARLLASAHLTLRGTFAHIAMIPGGRVYFLASDGPLTLDIAGRLEERRVATRLLHRAYLETVVAPDRLADLERAIATPAEINRDFNPSLYHRQVQHWLSQFQAAGGVTLAVAGLALAAYLVALPAMPRVIFASGFAASALEIVLLLGFQVFYGSLYQQVGLIVTVFMAGLAVGATVTMRWPVGPRRASLTAIGLGLAVAAIAALLPFALPRIGALDTMLASSLPGQAVISAATFVLASLVGAQFPLVSAGSTGGAATVAARLFSADLVGAAAGALLVSTWLIPLLGVTNVCLLTAALNIAAAAIASRQLRGQ